MTELSFLWRTEPNQITVLKIYIWISSYETKIQIHKRLGAAIWFGQQEWWSFSYMNIVIACSLSMTSLTQPRYRTLQPYSLFTYLRQDKMGSLSYILPFFAVWSNMTLVWIVFHPHLYPQLHYRVLSFLNNSAFVGTWDI